MTTSSIDIAVLYDQLDALLERHLTLLDVYQKSQAEVQKHMAEGFLSLAQANFKSSGRRRYGQDDYDQRMKASRRCRIDTDDESASRVKIESKPVMSASASAQSAESAAKVVEAEPVQQPSPPSTPLPEKDVQGPAEANSDSNATKKVSSSPESHRPDPSLADPLRWFGMLAPRELRVTQASFSAAFEAPLTQAVNTARDMRGLEVEIRKLRKAVRKAEKASAVPSGA